jgi:hypothetical protein
MHQRRLGKQMPDDAAPKVQSDTKLPLSRITVLDLTLARLNRRIDRTVTVAATGAVTIPVGPLAAGRYAATLTATDRAGNATTTRRILSITG